jgi:hypothetical protein
MQASQGTGIRQAVLLIDEQGEKIASAYLISYEKVLSLAKTLQLPIIFIGTITDSGRGINDSLHRAASGADLLMLWKKQPNAFEDTNLDEILKIKQVQDLVVMGFRTNCCVKETSIGSRKENQPDYFVPGAVQKGYGAKTNHLIVRDNGPATWVDEPGVVFYTQLSAKALPTPPKPGHLASKAIPTPSPTGTGNDTV